MLQTKEIVLRDFKESDIEKRFWGNAMKSVSYDSHGRRYCFFRGFNIKQMQNYNEMYLWYNGINYERIPPGMTR